MFSGRGALGGRGAEDGAETALLGPVPPGTWAVDALWLAHPMAGDQAGQVGAALRCGADWSGDGLSDCQVGAPTWKTEAGLDEAGAVLGLAPLLRVGETVQDVAEMQIEGSVAYERLGAAVADGDVDGDGVGDLVLGAPVDVDRESPKHTTKVGRAYLVRAPSGGGHVIADAGDQWLEGDPLAAFGAAVASGQDLDGDGYDDVVVGAPLQNGDGVGRGGVWVVSGDEVQRQPLGALDLLSLTSWSLSGEADGDLLGLSVALLPDLDGDGTAELAIGAPGVEGERGAALLYLGPLEGAATIAGARWTVMGSNGNDGVGKVVVDVGDVNGLGKHDLGVGAVDVVMTLTDSCSGFALVRFMDAW